MIFKSKSSFLPTLIVLFFLLLILFAVLYPRLKHGKDNSFLYKKHNFNPVTNSFKIDGNTRWLLAKCEVVNKDKDDLNLCLMDEAEKNVNCGAALSDFQSNLIIQYLTPRDLEKLNKEILYKFKIHNGSNTDVKNCSYIEVEKDTYWENIPTPFRANYLLQPSLKKNILFFGGSTLVDNGGVNHIPYMVKLILETYYPHKFNILNFATWCATFIDHIYNWDFIQKTKEERPLFSSIHFNGLYPNQVSKYWYRPEVQHNEFGIKRFRPSVIVVAQPWNDLYIIPWLKDGAKTPYYFGQPLTALFLQNIYEQYQSNGERSKDRSYFYSELMQLWENGKADPKILSSWEPREQGMKDTYKILLQKLLTKIRTDYPDVPIVFVSLPFEINLETPKNYIEYRFSTNLNLVHYVPFGFNLNFWSEMERAQVNATQEVVEKNKHIFHLNLKNKYHERYHTRSLQQLKNKVIFGDDLMHFNVWGNQWVTIEIANYLLSEVIPKL